MADTKETIRQIEEKLDRQVSRANMAQVAAIVLGALVIILLLWNFNRAAGVFEETMQPQEVARYVAGEVAPKVEGIHVQADQVVREHVPVMVDDFITDAIRNHLPALRKDMQESLKAGSKEKFQKYEDQIYAAVDGTMKTYSGQIRTFATELATEDGSQGFEDALYNLLNESLVSQDVAVELDSYGMALEEVSVSFDRLAAGEDLGPEEEALARLIAVTREISIRMQPAMKEMSDSVVLGIDAP